MAYGGPETIILNWVRTLDACRYESHLVCFENPDHTERPFVEAAERAGHRVRFIPWARRKPFLRSARAMAAIVRELDVDVLHCYNTYADIVGVLVKRLTGVKIITTLWVWGALGWKRRVLQWVERLALPFFDKVTAQSEDARRDTVQPGLPAERIDVLICGFSEPRVSLTPDQRVRERARLGAGEENFVLIHLARFWPEKAHDDLLRAFAIIRAGRPDARLWFAGVGPEKASIQAMAARLGLDPWVRFLGFRSDLPELLALADMQVHPSRAEGVPLALCSGMAAGLPIVATRVGGVPEVIRHGETGVLVEPGNPERFARAVLDLMADASRRRELGLGARRFLDEEYSLRAAAARVENAYKELCR